MAAKLVGFAVNCVFRVKKTPILCSRITAVGAPSLTLHPYSHPRYCSNASVASPVPKPKKARVSVTFTKPNGEKIKGEGKEGDSLLDIVVNSNVDLDGYGACEGTLACSTCHLIFKQQDFDKLPEKPTDEELDMLDLAFGLSDTSRLGCQIYMSKDLDGIEVEVPSGVNDARSSPT